MSRERAESLIYEERKAIESQPGRLHSGLTLGELTVADTRAALRYADERVESERKRLMEWVCPGCGLSRSSHTDDSNPVCTLEIAATKKYRITRAQYIAEHGERG